jgi:integrase
MRSIRAFLFNLLKIRPSYYCQCVRHPATLATVKEIGTLKKRITLLARIKLDEGKYGFEKIITDKNGRAIHPKAPSDATTFYLRYTEGGKRRVEPVGDDFEEACTRFLNAETRLEATKRGISVVLPGEQTDRLTVADAVREFIERTWTLDKSEATKYGYTRAVEQFRGNCRKTFLDEVNEKDMLEHIAWIQNGGIPTRSHGQRNGTIRTRLQYLTAFFSSHGLKNPLPMKHWPKTEEHNVEAFTSEEIIQLLSKATVDETDLIQFLLFTGFRDAEVAHTFYSDVDFERGTVNVSNKPELGFTIKNKKQRKSDITLPTSFLERLRDRRDRNGVNSNDALIFPNNDGGVDTCLLLRVRNAAKRAGYTEHFGLHKFRKTFGTRYAEKHGIVNAQRLLGHADIKTTRRYLAETPIAVEAVESLFADVVGK